MNEFTEKLIGGLEEYFDKSGLDNGKKIEMCKIVNELAEEHKDINIITNFLQYVRDNADNYDADNGWSLSDLIDLSIKFCDAEEHKDKPSDEWQIIYGKVCNLEKKYAESDESNGNANFCFTLKQLLRYFKEELRAEEYKGGWIPCSERLPSESGKYLVTAKNITGLWILENNVFVCDYAYDTFIFQGWEDNDVIAWQPLPEPYNPKGE